LFQMPISGSKGLPKMVTIMIAVMTILIILGAVAGYVANHNGAKP
jgi:hypothetical protein